MAESVGSLSLSSDTEIDLPCEPCGNVGVLREAAGYCPICVEFYCKNCLRMHRLSSATESHKIERGDKMPKSIDDKPEKYQICDKHNGAFKDEYCLNHVSVICPICFVSDHLKCNVEPVSEACKRFKIKDEEQKFYKQVKKFLEYAKAVKTSVEVNVSKLETQTDDILKDAKVQRDKIITQVEQKFQDFCTEARNIVKKQKEILTNKESVVDHVVVELSSILNSLQQSSTRKQNDQKKFLDLYKCAENVLLWKTEIQGLDINTVDLEFKFSGGIQRLVESISRLGDVSLHNSALQCDMSFPSIVFPYRQYQQDTDQSAQATSVAGSHRRPILNPTRLDKINVKLYDDTNDCLINGLDTTVDGNILLADPNNSKIKLFAPAGLLLCSLKLSGKPLDVTTVNKSEAAVSMWAKKIGIIGIGDSLTLKRIISTRDYVNSIMAYENNLIVTCDVSQWKISPVQMTAMSGEVTWTVTEDTYGNRLFDSARFLTTRHGNDGDTVIITDSSKHTIAVLDVKTGNANKIIDTKEKIPRGITVDDYGKVYVCYQSGEIGMFLGNMEEELCLVPGRERLEFEPGAMMYDHRRSQILITCNSLETKYSNFIYLYKLQTV